ncbi:hypothetical protein AAC387_Pa02g3129 [Persea americana]
MDYGKEKNWYFLTLLKPKTPCAKRPNHQTGLNEGVWKATGCPIPIMDDDDNITLGYKRSFCYYLQTKPKKEKTNWIMHEFTIYDKINWVLCKIHHHSSGSESSQEAEGVGDAAPEQFNTDDASYCLCTSQEPITALVPYSNDSQVYSTTNTMIDMEYDGNIQSVNNLCSLSAPSTPCVPPNTMIDMQFDDGNMQLVNNVWSSSSSAPCIPCMPSNIMTYMQFDGKMQSVNNLWTSSSSAASFPSVPSNTMIDVGNMQSVNNFWSSTSSEPTIPSEPSNTMIDVQFDGSMQCVNNLWSSSSTAPSIPSAPSSTMLDVQFEGNMQFANNLCSSSSSAKSMPCVTSRLSREDDPRFPSFHQNLEYPVDTLQSNETYSGINLLGNVGMFCGQQGPNSMNGSYDHSGTVGI